MPSFPSFCLRCPIEYKAEHCCNKQPETRASEVKKIKGKYYSVCPSLNSEGLCDRYPTKQCPTDTRPRICDQFECWKIVYDLDPSSTLENLENLEKEGMLVKRNRAGNIKLALSLDDIILPKED